MCTSYRIKYTTNLGFQILTVNHYFSEKCKKNQKPNNHAGFSRSIIFGKPQKSQKIGAGIYQFTYRGPFFSLLVIYIPFEVIHQATY